MRQLREREAKQLREAELCKLFPRQPKDQIIAITNNQFHPNNLTKLGWGSRYSEEEESRLDLEFSLSKHGKSWVSRPIVGKLSWLGDTPEKWSECFLIYVSIVSVAFGQEHHTIAAAMLTFHNEIIWPAGASNWTKKVLPLAISFHKSRIENDFFDFEGWKISERWSSQIGLCLADGP
jgi:hypothetical protein